MAIVCLHGLGRSPEDWTAVSRGLARFGPVETDAADLSPGSVLVGHSFAGPESLRIAVARAGRVAGVVLTNSFFPPARNGRTTAASVKDYARHRAAVAGAMASRPDRPRPTAAGGRSLAALARLGLRPGAFHALARAVRAPVLVVHTRDDHHVPVDFAQAAARAHPAWELVVLPHGGHNAHVDRPEAWLAAVGPWLEARTGPG